MVAAKATRTDFNMLGHTPRSSGAGETRGKPDPRSHNRLGVFDENVGTKRRPRFFCFFEVASLENGEGRRRD